VERKDGQEDGTRHVVSVGNRGPRSVFSWFIAGSSNEKLHTFLQHIYKFSFVSSGTLPFGGEASCGYFFTFYFISSFIVDHSHALPIHLGQPPPRYTTTNNTDIVTENFSKCPKKAKANLSSNPFAHLSNGINAKPSRLGTLCGRLLPKYTIKMPVRCPLRNCTEMHTI